MFKFPLKNPSPDFETLEKVLKGQKKPQRVHFVELLIDEAVIKFIVEKVMNKKWFSPSENEKTYLKQYIDFFYHLGYDYVPTSSFFGSGDLYKNLRALYNVRETSDTAILSKGKRGWADEGRGVIHSWQDFEEFPWKKITINLEWHKFINKNLPEGMKITFFSNLYEHVLEWLLGYEGLFYLLYDQPDLVKAIFDKLGKKVYTFYESIVSLDNVGAIFHADDLGYKTSTMLRPDTLRKLVFPWFKKYASLAHENGKMYWYHCCGYKYEIMEDLIKDVKIDALHSFEDVCCPVTEYKKSYGNRIAILGGVDMDKLCRLDDKNLRKYVKDILDECMSDGRYALGSGNSIANYVPVENYLIMLDEGLKWRTN